MFSIPLSLLKQIKAYCEENIDLGSVHFHTLMQVLDGGINKYTDYLGGGTHALGYTIIASTPAPNTVAARYAATYTETYSDILEPPKASDYPSKVAFLKAKIAFRINKTTAIIKSKGGSLNV